ncbi:MAG TPA: SOS response-associated peptidase [Roseiarcus sp.]|nr:SOS response-associated peptidase [Roseiarcus sp.]
MCVRFALTSPSAILRARFGYDEAPDFPPRADIMPTQPIAVVMARPYTGGRGRNFRLVRWGFLPGFVKDPASFPLIVNARAESVTEKASFAAAFKRRRCLAPADGFYSGRTEKSALFQAADGAPFGLAALYETYCDASGGEIDTACILTTPANALLSAFGERMPALIAAADFSAWLDHEQTTLGAALDLLRPAPEAQLRRGR